MPESLEAARRDLGFTYMDLWIEYFALGGYLDVSGLAGYLSGTHEATRNDHNLIAHALNETYRDRGQDNPVRYRTT